MLNKNTSKPETSVDAENIISNYKSINWVTINEFITFAMELLQNKLKYITIYVNKVIYS